MTSILPPIPRFIFTILEPLMLIGGAVFPVVDPAGFVASQMGHLPSHPLYETEHVLALQLGNIYFLLCLMGLFILNTTTEPKVVRAYLWAAWTADISHIGVTGWVMGYDVFVNVAEWNSMAYGNIAITAFLFISRSLYFMGAFGEDKVVPLKTTRKQH